MGPRLDKLARWLEREEWTDLFDDWIDLHCDVACRDAGVTRADLPRLVGDPALIVVTGTAFNDFFSVIGEEGEAFADHYLKRRGYGESTGNKTYIKTIQTSVMSLYEVTAVTPGASFEAIDLLRGGAPVQFREKAGSQCLEPGIVAAIRRIHFMRQDEVAGGMLVFEPEEGAQLVAACRQVLDDPELLTDDDLEAARSPTEDPHLRALAPLITNAWVAQEFTFADR